MSVSVSECMCVKSDMLHMMQRHAKLGWALVSHAGDTAPHACGRGVLEFFFYSMWLYKAEYQNNHDDGCGVLFC